jgi:hypothetical protein
MNTFALHKYKHSMNNSLKTCVVIAAELISGIGHVLEDKKVQFSEILGLAPELLKIPKFVGNISAAIDELKTGISPEYSAEIKQAVADKLHLINDKAETITEICINWIVITSSTVLQVIKVVKK